jgi:hypothetical protein
MVEAEVSAHNFWRLAVARQAALNITTPNARRTCKTG